MSEADDRDNEETEGQLVEYESIEDEFRALLSDCQQTETKLMQIAARLAPRAADAADVLRQVTGEILPLLQNLVMASGSALATIESQQDSIDAEFEGVSLEDAAMFYMGITANQKLVEDALLAAVTDEQRKAIESIKEMNRQMIVKLVELSGEEEEDIRKAAESSLHEGEPPTGVH